MLQPKQKKAEGYSKLLEFSLEKQMHRFTSSIMVVLATYSLAQSPVSPVTQLTQHQACAQFTDAVVRIDAGGKSLGTGFIVSPDGFILTAAHVIRDENGEFFSTVAVTLPTGIAFANPIPQTLESAGADFAVLKVETKVPLPALKLGSTTDAEVGSDATIIGFPMSAMTLQDKPIFNKFCLSATFVAKDLLTVPVRGTINGPKGVTPTQKELKVDVIYFQGVSVKGISGSPIIARETGRVVGIVSVKLTGVGQSLINLKKNTEKGLGGNVLISGYNRARLLMK